MNILLLNDNPVVTKLVTLSAQKTGSEIFIASNIDEIQNDFYDLIIVDEALYSFSFMDELKSKITYKRSIYMLSRGAQGVDAFDYEVKKPFLPTDLVELLGSISTSLAKVNDESVIPECSDFKEDLDMNKDLKEEVFIDSGIMDDLDLDSLDLNLDEIDLENLGIKDDEIGSILDKDEVQEVKNLLDEAELQEDELNFNLDDVTFDDDKSLLQTDKPELEELENDFSFDEIDMPIDFKEDTQEELHAQENIEESKEGLLFEDDWDHEAFVAAETVPVDNKEIDEEDLDFDMLDDEIQSAVGALSQDDLDQEMDMNFDDLDEFATLDEKSLKIALGEEDASEVELTLDDELLSKTEHEFHEELAPVAKEETSEPSTDGADALKALLKALSNEDVVASLKGMNVSINISFGKNSDK